MNNFRDSYYGRASAAVAVCLITLMFSNTVVGRQTQGLSPLQVAKLKHVEDVVIAGEGNKVAYTLEVPANPLKENEKAAFHLYILDLLSGASTPFVTSMSVYDVQFRPNHNSVTFLGRRTNEKVNSLYEISLNGGEAKKLYSFRTPITGYDWAPDGNQLAFMAPQPPQEADTLVLPYKPEIYEENLTQHHGYITNVTQPIYMPQRLLISGSVYQMHWSPDGSRLAVAVAPTPLADDYYMKQRVIIFNRQGKLKLTEIEHRGKLGQVEWSPDGKYLAMIAAADVHDPVAGRLFVVSADGGKPNNLKPDFGGKFEQFQWADSTTLHYLTSKGVWSTYGRIDRDGSDMQIIINTGGPVLHEFSRSGTTGTCVFIADSPAHPGELYIMKKDDRAPKRVTNSNPWLENIALGKQEVVTWQARDSLQLEGLLIYPLNFVRGQTYPLITVVHGGPESHYHNGWLTNYAQPGQVGAARGFFVFYPNYRGSSGRGEAFAKSSQNDLAGAEFDDIIAGVDQLVAVGIIDEDKVGVTGASYGGYATAWLATRYTNRFAAGVMLAGISNNISKWATSNIPEELYLVHMRRHIWEDYEYYLKRSPIYYAGQTKTPLLITTGKEDVRVDPGQSYELYRHIKTRTDTPVRLVLYPGEGHGYTGATARLDYNMRMMRWLGKYLKGEKLRPDSEIETVEVEITGIGEGGE